MIAANQLNRNKELYVQYMKQYFDFEDYLSKLEIGQSNGTELELYIFSKTYDCSFVILRNNIEVKTVNYPTLTIFDRSLTQLSQVKKEAELSTYPTILKE